MFSIRLLWITSLLIVVLVIASAISAAQEVVTFWHYGAASVLEVMQQLAADFEAENPGIKIEIVNVPYTPDFEKWTVALAGGAGPDASLGNFGVFAALGDALVPLEGFAERSEDIKKENFFPAHWEANWYRGQLLALPFRANSQVILYDKRVFNEAGISGVPDTWAELDQYATRLTVTKGDTVERWGFSFRNYFHNRTVDHFGQRNGWQPFDPDYTVANYTDPKLIQTLEFLNGMVTRGVAAIQGMPGVGNLAGGQVAMLNDGNWALNSILAQNPDIEVGAFVPPVGPSGEQPYANLGGENLVMFKSAKNKEATWKWISYLAYERNADYNRMVGTFFPVVSYAASDPYWFESEIWRAVLTNYQTGRMPLGGSACGVQFASTDAYHAALDDIFRQRQAIGVALAAVQQIAVNDLKNPELQACRN